MTRMKDGQLRNCSNILTSKNSVSLNISKCHNLQQVLKVLRDLLALIWPTISLVIQGETLITPQMLK